VLFLITPVGAEESCRDGDGFFVGLGVLAAVRTTADHSAPLFGAELQMFYALKQFRLNFAISFMEYKSMARFIGFGATYVPLSGFWSPFAGVNIGSFASGNWHIRTFENTYYYDEQSGLGVAVHGGVELFRNRPTRVVVEVGCYFPVFYTERRDFSVDRVEKYMVIPYSRIAVMW
jgi:hypothetical protein